jgi:hypothetical protein
MSEGIPTHSEKEPTRKEKIIALAVELSESRESFAFPGIDPEFYSKIKAGQEEDPDHSTPIDELVERFKNEGMKVVLGKYPESGNVFILPAQSDDIENDSVFPRHLQINEGMNDKLKELISLGRS